jgi:hypothetical protein
VRVWRRLGQIGAVALKNGAYVLPDTEEALEDLTWLRQEILDAGGGALLLRAQALETADQEVEQLFRAERDGDYAKLTDDVETLVRSLREPGSLDPGAVVDAERTLRQLRERLTTIQRLDFFAAEQGPVAQAALRAAADLLEARREPSVRLPDLVDGAAEAVTERLWVTRAGVYVDRLACAWMIRRFIDPEAQFRFVRPGDPLPEGAIPFDMAGVELGHHGPRCSAEVVAARYRADDLALRAVAEVVHDLDLKDEGFGRLEAPGLKRLLDGICSGALQDLERIERTGPLFEALYLGFVSAGG